MLTATPTFVDERALFGLVVKTAKGFTRARTEKFDELISAGLVGAAEAIHTFNPAKGDSLLGWATWHIRGRMFDALRRERRRRESAIDEDALRSMAAPRAPELCDWEHYFRHLTPRQRQVFELRFLHGLQFDQIGRRLQLTTQGASARYRTGLLRLRHALQGERQ